MADGWRNASVKRTQGRYQAAGGFAFPRKLIQPRKSLDAEADLVTLQGRPYQAARIGKRWEVPSGSSKTVARYQRSVLDEPQLPCGRTGAPRTREALLPSLPFGQAVCIQLEEVAVGSGKESDPLIVVRDGRADHTPSQSFGSAGMAKGWAERQSEHSTHCGTRALPIPVSSTLLALAAKVRFSEPDAKPSARLSEEPCAGKPHAGICEGGAR